MRGVRERRDEGKAFGRGPQGGNLGRGSGGSQHYRALPAGRVASFSVPGSSSRYSLGPSLRRGHEVSERVQSNEMGSSVLIMQPILRFLQLLCENHNRDLQVSAGPALQPAPAPPPPAWAPPLLQPRPLCSAELSALPEQQDQLQPGV